MKKMVKSDSGMDINAMEAPVRSLSAPALLHIELTTRCPLRCPQCYAGKVAGPGSDACSGIDRHRDMDRDVLMRLIREAAGLKIRHIALSGGEPLLYPFLTEIVKYISDCGVASTMATSGYGLTAAALAKLLEAGMGIIWISLNGSTEVIHNHSRDEFYETVKAMSLLKESGSTYGINWVARRDNVFDFPNVVEMAAQYGARHINILLSKPGKGNDPDSYLGGGGYYGLVEFIKNANMHSNRLGDKHKQGADLSITVEYCYSYLRAVTESEPSEGIYAGCLAGRAMIAVDVDGRFRPCRHLPFPEDWQGISEYWFGSKMLGKLRATEEHIGEPCRSCRYLGGCRTCRKVCLSFRDGFYSGQENCPNIG